MNAHQRRKQRRKSVWFDLEASSNSFYMKGGVRAGVLGCLPHLMHRFRSPGKSVLMPYQAEDMMAVISKFHKVDFDIVWLDDADKPKTT